MDLPTPDEWRRLLGRKVSIRFSLHGDPDHRFSEASGVLMAVDDRLTILKKSGDRVEVAIDDVVAAKVFER